MPKTRLSSKGQVIIPKSIREAFGWEVGQEFEVIVMADGIALQPQLPFAPTTLDDVAGCLPYDGPTVSVEDMEAAIARGVKERFDGLR